MLQFKSGENLRDPGFKVAKIDQAQGILQVEGTVESVPEAFPWIRRDR
jgi:hypothetical protein